MLMECVRFEQYIADKIDSGSEMPAKPVIIPDILQEVRQPRLWLPFATQHCLLRRGLKSAVTTLPGSEIGVCIAGTLRCGFGLSFESKRGHVFV